MVDGMSKWCCCFIPSMKTTSCIPRRTSETDRNGEPRKQLHGSTHPPPQCVEPARTSVALTASTLGSSDLQREDSKREEIKRKETTITTTTTSPSQHVVREKCRMFVVEAMRHQEMLHWPKMSVAMSECLRVSTQSGVDLERYERLLLILAFKMWIKSQREEWRQARDRGNTPREKVLRECIVETCSTFLRSVLYHRERLHTVSSAEARVDYTGLCADFYRYWGEVEPHVRLHCTYDHYHHSIGRLSSVPSSTSHQWSTPTERALVCYDEAWQVACRQLLLGDPTRLCLLLNYTMCLRLRPTHSERLVAYSLARAECDAVGATTTTTTANNKWEPESVDLLRRLHHITQVWAVEETTTSPPLSLPPPPQPIHTRVATPLSVTTLHDILPGLRHVSSS